MSVDSEFLYFSGSFKSFIAGLSDAKMLIMKDVPLWINITYSIVYMIASFYSIIQVVKLAFRIKSARKQFLIVIPLLWVIN